MIIAWKHLDECEHLTFGNFQYIFYLTQLRLRLIIQNDISLSLSPSINFICKQNVAKLLFGEEDGNY